MPTPKPAHTPGPWKVGIRGPLADERDRLFSHADVIKGGIRIARVAGIGDEECAANAALIAAAPETKAQRDELLEACKGLVKALEHDMPGIIGNQAGAGLGVEYKFAKSAISKCEVK